MSGYRIFPIVTAVALLCTGPALIPGLRLTSQTAPEREISIVLGRGELLQFQRDIQKVAVSEPKIADAVVVSPREVMVNGKGAGQATLVIWEEGTIPARYNVRVGSDESQLNMLRKHISDSVPDGAISVSGNPDTLVLSGRVGSADESKRAGALASTYSKNVVNLLEIPAPPEPRQVMLQVKFASVDRVAFSELGFNFFSRNPALVGALSTQQFQSPRFGPLQLDGEALGPTTVNFADLLNIFLFRPDVNIGATIRALESRNLLQILAEPNLVAVEGKEASFIAGGEFPFPILTSTSTGGAISPVISVQFKQFGVQLGFVPTVTADGAIHLRVRPEVSALDFSNSVQLQGFLIPAISSRRAETEVILRDSESFAIAGLIDNRVVQVLSRIKGLGDIPIIGHLFRSRATKKSTDELLVVITPHFVKPLSAGESAKLPATLVPFLPDEAEIKAAIAARKEKEKQEKEQKKNQPKAEFVGPRGHQEPK